MLIIPYEVDIPFERRPIANWLLFASIILVFLLQMASAFDMGGMSHTEDAFADYILDGFSLKGFFGHMWLHGGIIHVVGNLIFLWVFGNAVCQKIGNLLYLPLYLFVGIFAAVVHVIFSGQPAIGASGAINGIVAVYLMFFPVHDISCFWLWWVRFGTFSVSGFWMILLWLAFDIWGVIRGGGGVAYFAHLGGFAAGIGIGMLLLVTKVAKMDEFDESLLQIITHGRRKQEEPSLSRTRTDFEIRQLLDRQQYGDLDATDPEPMHPVALSTEKKRRPLDPPPQKAPQQLMRFHCSCGQKIKMPVEYAGRTGRCPKCRRTITVPSPDA